MELLSYSDRYPILLRRYESPFKILFLHGHVGLLDVLNEDWDRLISFTGSRYIEKYDKKSIAKILQDTNMKFNPSIVITGGARGCDRLVIDYFDRKGVGNVICVPSITTKILNEFHYLKNYLLIGIYPTEKIMCKEMFLERNKLVAGLSKNVIFLKGGLRSGSMNTAGIALNIGNMVWVNGHSINSEGYEGNEMLLKKKLENVFQL